MFEEELLVCDLGGRETRGPIAPIPRREEEVFRALMTGTRDYVEKNRFPGVIVGLSGGLDSSIVATIAVEALSPSRVLGVTMSSPYTSTESVEDAHALAANLGIRCIDLSISEAFDAFRNTLAEPFRNLAADATEENLQARIRGTLLMALSNKFGSIVLATGNKSEMSVGYATLYGDMVGGLRGHQGCLQDDGVPRRRAGTTKAAGATSSRSACSRSRRPPSSSPARRTRTPCPEYEVLDPILQTVRRAGPAASPR